MFTHYFLLCSNSIKAATLFFGVVDKIQIKSPLYGYKENAIRLSHMSEQQQKGINVSCGLHVLHMF